MNYTIEKLIYLLTVTLSHNDLLDSEAFDMVNKLCTKLNNIED
jgi:hypothetical protein